MSLVVANRTDSSVVRRSALYQFDVVRNHTPEGAVARHTQCHPRIAIVGDIALPERARSANRELAALDKRKGVFDRHRLWR